jgi:hypothetical protein
MRINTIIDYFMVLALVFVSGNILFTNRTMLFTLFILSTIVFFYRKIKFDTGFVYFLVGLTVIFILQIFKFDFFPAFTYAGVYVRILVAYFILKSVMNFSDKFVKVMYYLSIISFIFYIPILLVPGFSDFLLNNLVLYARIEDGIQARFNIMGVYTIVPGHDLRSSGPFWEMGAFAGYLILALIISYLKKPELNNKINIVLSLAILTTQSSTGYISFLIFLAFIFNQEVKNVALKGILALSMFFVGYFAYTNLDFLGKKIETQYEEALALVNTENLEGESTDRFSNMLKDWRDIQGHELIGRGFHNKTRFTSMYDAEDVSNIRTVGSTDILVRLGLPMFIWMIFLMYVSFSKFSKYYWKNGNYMGISIVLIIMLLLTSETYFEYPLFWIVMMLHYTIAENNKNIKIINKKEIKIVSKIENKFYNLNN